MHNETLEILACLFYEVSNRFYALSGEQYVEAMEEVSKLAKAKGYTVNDLAKVIAYRDINEHTI